MSLDIFNTVVKNIPYFYKSLFFHSILFLSFLKEHFILPRHLLYISIKNLKEVLLAL